MFPRILLVLSFATSFANGYFLVGIENVLTQQRLDPIVSPGKVASHTHTVLGGSNFGLTTNTSFLRQSQCTSNPIIQDKSNYWFPSLYFQWKNGSFNSVDGSAVIYYLFDDKPGMTTAFPDDLRMISGNPLLRTYDPTSYAQQAVSFLCLDFFGNSTRHSGLPSTPCASGVRAQINFPSCWNGKDLDTPDHKSHVAFRAGGPDVGDCSDPNFPITLPRIFMEYYLDTMSWDKYREQAMDSSQPFVYSYGDRTGYGYHADFVNGWDKGVLQDVVDKCNCNPFGDPTCCKNAGLFDLKPNGQDCFITNTVDEKTTGNLAKLPGNNPIQPEGRTAVVHSALEIPAIIHPVYVYTSSQSRPSANGTIAYPTHAGAATAHPSVHSSADSSAESSKPSTSKCDPQLTRLKKKHLTRFHRRGIFANEHTF